jgi:hypothetical protein
LKELLADNSGFGFAGRRTTDSWQQLPVRFQQFFCKVPRPLQFFLRGSWPLDQSAALQVWQ